MRRCGYGGTGSVRCSPRRYGNAAFINDPIRTGMTPGRNLREDQRRPHYLWRAVDHEGGILEVFATKRRDGKAVLKFLKRAMKRYGRPTVIVTDRLRSYRAAMNIIGNTAAQESSRWMNNRAENSYQSFRRREDAMSKFRDIKTMQKVRLDTGFNPQSLQPRKTSHLTRGLYGKTRSCPCRMAGTFYCINHHI